MADNAIRVTGAKELRKTLRQMDEPGLLKELGKANNRMASLVVDRAQGRARSNMQRAAAGRLRAGKGAAKATVTLGGKPYDFGAEFGAVRNVTRQRATGTYRGLNQFEPWRGSGGNAGYFLYPAIRESRDELVDMYGDEIDRLFRKGD